MLPAVNHGGRRGRRRGRFLRDSAARRFWLKCLRILARPAGYSNACDRCLTTSVAGWGMSPSTKLRAGPLTRLRACGYGIIGREAGFLMKRIVLCAIALTVAAAGPLGAQATPAPAQPQSVVLQKVLVKVNGAIFTKRELEDLQIETLAEQNKRRLSQMDLQTDAKLQEELVRITPEILANAIDELILVQ